MIPELANLPSSGILSDVENFTWQRRQIPYVCGSNTDASPEQVLENDDPTESLVRILKRQQQAVAKVQHTDAKGKRPSENNEAPGAKKMAVSSALTAGNGAGPSTSAAHVDLKRTYTQEELKGKTVKELQDCLKARGMPVSGKKEALMQRIIDFQRRQKVATLGHG